MKKCTTKKSKPRPSPRPHPATERIASSREMNRVAHDAQRQGYLTIDVTPADLVDGGRRMILLRDLLDDIDRQWPQGRDPTHNGYGTRIGTLYIYFDSAHVLHIHFAERGSYLRPDGGLSVVPDGHLPGYFVAPHFDEGDTPACEVGDLLVRLPVDVSPKDARWEEVATLLRAMAKAPKKSHEKVAERPRRLVIRGVKRAKKATKRR